MSEWISVKDKLPDKPGEYLVYYKGRAGLIDYAAFGEYSVGYFRGTSWDNNSYRGYVITHWVPLPKQPEDA